MWLFCVFSGENTNQQPKLDMYGAKEELSALLSLVVETIRKVARIKYHLHSIQPEDDFRMR